MEKKYVVCFVGNGVATALAPDNIISRHDTYDAAEKALTRHVRTGRAIRRNYAVIDADTARPTFGHNEGI